MERFGRVTYQYVTVTYTWTFGGEEDENTNATPAGRWEWYPSGPVEDTNLHESIDVPTQLGQLDSSGTMSVSLLATDNADLSDFNWIFNKWIQGEDSEPVAYIVNHADGAEQTLDSLTQAS
jgi:hypothetical protein